MGIHISDGHHFAIGGFYQCGFACRKVFQRRLFDIHLIGVDPKMARFQAAVGIFIQSQALGHSNLQKT